MSPRVLNPFSSGPAGFRVLSENPLYDYLLDLQEKRIILVEALAPRRHLAWQMWVGASVALLWITDLTSDQTGIRGLPIALLILLGPFFVLGGIYLAGWTAQLIAVRNYPSPLDSPQALELLLSTPLTEKEIVTATIGAFIRYPFMGMSWRKLVLVVLNLAGLTAAVFESNSRGTLPPGVLFMSLDMYLPALCVYLFFPILTALDLLIVPSGWLRKHSDNEARPNEGFMGRTGRLPAIAMFLALALALTGVNIIGPLTLDAVRWVFTFTCPIILMLLAIATAVIVALLPAHLAHIRRG